MKTNLLIISLFATLFLSSCTIIRQIAEGLTPLLIRFKTIEAFNKLANSPNSKVIITNGDQPLLMNGDKL